MKQQPPADRPDWFDSPLRRRLLLRLLIALPQGLDRVGARAGTRSASLAAQASLWRVVKRAATATEWRRLTRSSYVVIYYHRLSGELKPGQERLDVAPAQFSAQMRALRRLGFRALAPEQVAAYHDGSPVPLPRRGYVVTADDGFLDCVEPFLRHAALHPQLFVPSAEVGGHSWWAGDEPLAGWEDLRRLAAAGVGIGSHARRHLALDELDEEVMREDLAGSRQELAAGVGAAVSALAYPHGRRDERVLAATRAAGYALAFTTDPGRNGVGTDRLQLRRVGIKAWDSRASFLFKVLTGELLPPHWERRRIKRGLPSYHRRLSTPSQTGA